MNTIYFKIKRELEKSPRGRERKNKNKFIAFLLWNRYMLEGKTFTPELLESLLVDYSSYDRKWRECLSDNPQLRGSDYGDKKKLSQEYALNLGYEPQPQKIKV